MPGAVANALLGGVCAPCSAGELSSNFTETFTVIGQCLPRCLPLLDTIVTRALSRWLDVLPEPEQQNAWHRVDGEVTEF